MRVLAFDPGALRCGWAIVSEGQGKYEYHDSGIYGLDRLDSPKEPYQQYRLRLIKYWAHTSSWLYADNWVDGVVSEIIPAVGGGNFGADTQGKLAATVQTVIETMAHWAHLSIWQLAAVTVKKQVTGVGRATKPKVRDGVLTMLPELESRRKEWTGKDAVWDEVDALAVGLAYLKRNKK